MAVIAPLRPLHFAPEQLATLVAPPYDVISPEERAALAARDPHNVVRLILPEGEGDTKYARAAEILAAWRKEGVLTRDDRPQFLRYDQRFTLPDGRAGHRRGFLGLVRVVPLADPAAPPQARVLPHERTLSGPKEDRLKLFRATRTNLSPGFLLYKDPGQKLAPALEKAEPVARFSTPDGIEHEISRIVDPAAVAALVAGVGDSALLIADGHHRYETALRYRDEARAAASASGLPLPEHAEPNYFLAFFASEDDPRSRRSPDPPSPPRSAGGQDSLRSWRRRLVRSDRSAAVGRGRRARRSPRRERHRRQRERRHECEAAELRRRLSRWQRHLARLEDQRGRARRASHLGRAQPAPARRRRGAPPLRSARARHRPHQGSAGREDEPLVPARCRRGAGEASRRREGREGTTAEARSFS